MVERMRHKQNPKKFELQPFSGCFLYFTRNILRTQCGVSCVKSDGVVVVVQIYSIDKDANEALPLDLTVARKILKVLQKSENMRQLKPGLFSLLFSQLLLKLCLFSFTLFKSFCDSINRTTFFKCDPQIFNGFLSFPNCYCQSLDRKVLAVILTCGNDFFSDDLDAFRSEELGTGISDLCFNQCFGNNFLITSLELDTIAAVVVIRLTQLSSTAVARHRFTAVTTEQLGG